MVRDIRVRPERGGWRSNEEWRRCEPCARSSQFWPLFEYVPDSGDRQHFKINCTSCCNGFLLGRLKRFKRRIVLSEIKGTWKFYYDNVLSHTAFVINDFLVWTSTAMVPKLPYNSDLVATDIFLFSSIKGILKGEYLAFIADISARAKQVL